MSESHFSQDNEQDDLESVTLIDEYERSLDCYIEQSLESEGYTYMLLQPLDTPVVIIAWDKDKDQDLSQAVLLEDATEIEEIFADAKAVLAELDLILKHTAFTLTARGQLPPLEEDAILSFEFDDESSKIEPEQLQFLASFYHNKQKYSIYTPLAPLLFFVRTNLVGELEMVSPEDKEFESILEELLFDEFE